MLLGSFLCCVDKEAGVCVSSEICRRATRPGTAIHQHLPEGLEG